MPIVKKYEAVELRQGSKVQKAQFDISKIRSFNKEAEDRFEQFKAEMSTLR